jgi:hypothetical protein
MRLFKRLHCGGMSVDFFETCDPSSSYPVRMQVFGGDFEHTFELSTEIADDLRHALRQASKITRAYDRQSGRR